MVSVKNPELGFEKASKIGTESGLRSEFQRLVAQWQEETVDYSILNLRYGHPVFLKVIALGPRIIPLILEELKARPDWWFEALTALTGEDPTKPEDSFDEATQKWLEWGKRNHFDV